MKPTIKILISIFFLMFLISCDGGGGGKSSHNSDDNTVVADDIEDDTENDNIENDTEIEEPETPVIEEGEKTYTVNPLPDALFYYWTESGKLYKISGNAITAYTMTATVSQDGHPDTEINIYPTEFYKLGDFYFFIIPIGGVEKKYRQLYGEIIEVDELMRHPDIYWKEMDNGRFSITTNTYDIYTVSDIRNITSSSGIVRTAMVQNYKIGEYNSWTYGLWFCAIDDDLSITRSGLYYWPEVDDSKYKIIDEKGEMW